MIWKHLFCSRVFAIIKSNRLLSAFIIAHAVIFILFNSSLYPHHFSSFAIFMDYASQIIQGHMPYRDFSFEYPPIALVFFILPRLFSSDYLIFYILFCFEVIAFDVIGILLVAAIARQLKQSLALRLGIFSLALLFIGPIVYLRYDLFPAIMVLAAIYAFHENKHKTAWVILALGTMTKIYPLLVAPLFFVYYLAHRQYRRLITGILSFMFVSLITTLPFLVMTGNGFIDFLKYQASRGLQIESSYSSVLLLLHNLRLVSINIYTGWGSVNTGGSLADYLAGLSTPISLVLLGTVYFIFLRNQLKSEFRLEPPNAIASHITDYTVLVIIIFMVSGKVLSPQFIVWLYPLIPLIVSPWHCAAWITFMIVGLLTMYIYPIHYIELTYLEPITVYVLFCRNILLALLGGFLAIKEPPRSFRLKNFSRYILHNLRSFRLFRNSESQK
jgi:uncharacterized membrane protein